MERIFLCIASLRPSELLKVLAPAGDADEGAVGGGRPAAADSAAGQQAEDAMSQGMEKFHLLAEESLTPFHSRWQRLEKKAPMVSCKYV